MCAIMFVIFFGLPCKDIYKYVKLYFIDLVNTLHFFIMEWAHASLVVDKLCETSVATRHFIVSIYLIMGLLLLQGMFFMNASYVKKYLSCFTGLIHKCDHVFNTTLH